MRDFTGTRCEVCGGICKEVAVRKVLDRQHAIHYSLYVFSLLVCVNLDNYVPDLWSPALTGRLNTHEKGTFLFEVLCQS